MAVFQRIKNVFKAVATARKALAGSDFIPLEEALDVLFQQADFVHLADTDHREEAICTWLADAQNLQKLHDRGVRTICIEELRPFQVFGDALAAGHLDVEDFTQAMKNAGVTFIFGDSDKGLQKEGTLIVNAAAAGIRVLFADPSNGNGELAAAKDYCEKSGLGREFFFLADDREREKRFDAAPPEVAAEFKRLRENWLKARNEDKPTVEFMKANATGKTLILYGAGHNFSEDFRALGATARKISVFAKARAYGQSLRTPASSVLGDSVYLMDKGLHCVPPTLQALPANENKPDENKPGQNRPSAAPPGQ